MSPRPPAPAEVMAMLPDPVVVVDPVGTIVWGNDAIIDFTGFDPDIWIGRSVFDILHPDDHAIALSAFASVGDKGVGGLLDIRIQDSHGKWRSCEVRGRAVPAGTWPGLDEAIVIGMRDTADRQALELGKGDTDRMRAIVHHATSILAALDEHGRILSVNGELNRVLGIDSVDVIGRPFSELLVADDRPTFRDTLTSMGPLARVEARADCADGGSVHLDISLADLREDEVVRGYTLSAADITDLKNTQRALRHMADHDALTGLLSRRSLLAQLDHLVDDGYQHEIVILFCDLDGFKAVNDRIGHAAGDQVLIEVARRLERSIRPGDLVGRLGGDEFVVVLPRSSPHEADIVSADIRAALIEPIFAADEVVEVDVSIGCATTGDSPTAARLLATADDAMYAVKRNRAAHR